MTACVWWSCELLCGLWSCSIGSLGGRYVGSMGRRWTVWSSRSLVRVVYSSSSSRRMEKQEGRREEKVQPVKDCGRSWRSMGSPGLI